MESKYNFAKYNKNVTKYLLQTNLPKSLNMLFLVEIKQRQEGHQV